MTVAATKVTAAGQAMWRDPERCYRAVASRDARFDGQFIVAVKTTGIYCRPSCPAVTPKAANVRFYPTSAAAQAGGFRACRRCLPDAVPGSPEWNLRADLAARAMRLIADGVVEREGVPGLASRLGYSERQLGRVLTNELGAGPLALARAHRAHAARLLIELSAMPLSDVAFAAGFASVRQFNDTIREVFARTPSQLRATAAASRGREQELLREDTVGTRLSLRLPFRKPFDASGIFGFLAARAVPGVEWAHDGHYGRTLRLPHGPGAIEVSPADGYVRCELRLTDVRDLGTAVARTRRLLDLDADPEAVLRVLGTDPALAPVVAQAPGIRLPGAIDGAELTLRALLDQPPMAATPSAATASVAAPSASTGAPSAAAQPSTGALSAGAPLPAQPSVAAQPSAAELLVDALGERLPWGTLFPTAEAIAEHAHEVLPTGGPHADAGRADTVRTVAEALATRAVQVHIGRDADELRTELLALPGLDPRTADYVVMRVLGVPDMLLTHDPAVRTGAAALGITDLTRHAQAWRPWRSYAGMYLQRSATNAAEASEGKNP